MSEIPQGAIRFNTDSQRLEFYAQGEWWVMSTDTPNLGTSGDSTPGARGIFAGANPIDGGADGSLNVVDYINISSTGNSVAFGTRIGKGRRQIAAMADRTRAVFAGSYSPLSNIIDFVTIASTGDALDFGDTFSAGTNQNLIEATGISNSTRGIMAGGRSPSVHDIISYVTIQSKGDALDFGDLTGAKRNCGSCQSPVRGIIGGGRNPGGTDLKDIEFITTATLGDAQDFGDLTNAGQNIMGGGNGIRGIFAGGNPATTAIEYITISSTGNSTDFGDNTNAVSRMNTMMCSPTRAVMHGSAAPARSLSYVNIQTTGNAVEFGNITTDPDSNYNSGCSNAHGGL